MKTLAIDIETYRSVSLQKCGVYAYAQSPDFEILLFGYAWDDGPVEVIDLAKGQSLPQELQDALYDPEILKTAFNASFERTCLSAFMGRVTPPEQWSCTAVMARELGLPGSLEAVGEVIGLPEDKQKSKTGRALIRYFSIPCKPTKTNGNRTRNLPEHDPDRWNLYVEYNRQDVEAERAIRKKLSRFPIYEKEQPLWVHDQHINDRGVGVDLSLAEHAVEIDGVIEDGITEDMCLQICQKYDLVHPLYAYFKRLGCWQCPKQSLSSLRALYQNWPEKWQKLEQYQRDCAWDFQPNRSVFDLSERFRKEFHNEDR